MIRIRLANIDGQPIDKEIIPKETLSSAVDRSLKGLIPEETDPKEHFIVLVNGLKVDKELWGNVDLKEKDIVVISPMLQGGDASNLLRTALIITATLLVPGPLAGLLNITTQVGTALLTAGVSIAASMIFTALIPPPNPEIESGGQGDTSSSQMYQISGQQNTVRRYGTVPKVYGTHRMFPVVAANPYTELEADPDNGSLVQYFYAIYDFGLGPLEVTQLKIGDTPIDDFSDVQYRLVDLNKPAVSEGTWDDNTYDSFAFYKGDVERESVNVAINEDEAVGVPLADYQVIRTVAPNTLNAAQEINITLLNPGGLYAFSPTGERRPRTIDLDIEFSKVGENIWRGFNDPVYVDDHLAVGGSDVYTPQPVTLHPPGTTTGGALYPETQTMTDSSFRQIASTSQAAWGIIYRYFGLLKGATSVVLATDATIVGKYLKIKGVDCGLVTSGTAYAVGYTTYTFTKPLEANITLFRFEQHGNDDFILSEEEEAGSDLSVVGKGTASTLVVGRARIERNETGQVYSSFKFTPKDIASYKVRITRKATFSDVNSTVADDLTWAGLAARFDRDPVVTDKRHTFLEIRIRATNQLNGSISNLSAVCSSVLDVYDGVSWEKEVTANPAWVFTDLLTGEINKRALDRDRLDLVSIVEWADFCDAIPTPPPSQTFTLPRFYCNLVVDYDPTLQSIINQVTSAAQASLNIVDGKYGVLIDKLRTVPVQIFTPRNSSAFSSSRSFTKQPNALKVTYVDPSADWETRETIVYDDGFDASTAETFDEINSFGCTNPQQAWRFGRYILAQNKLRQEKIQITVDFESLVCTRGDYVQITQDVMRVGGTPARVKSITGNQIVIDDAIETNLDPYGYVFRAADGSIYQNTLTVVSADTFNLVGTPLPVVGDLIVIGNVGEIVLDCIVKSIEPIDDMSANLTLVEKADAIYSAESTDVLPDYSPQISATTSTDFSPPAEVENLQVTDSFYECNGNALDYKVSIDWDVPSGAAFDIFEIWVDAGRGYNLIATTKESLYTYLVDRDDLGNTHNFKVLAVSATGRKLDIGSVGSVSQLVTLKTDPPSDITVFNADITGEVLQLFWTRITDCSCREYIIRYSPTTTGSWSQSIPLLRVDANTSSASFQARTGTYLIKAIDFEGNESDTEAAVITTIPNLFGLNVIAETTDFPTLPGVMDRVVNDTGALTLDNTIVGGVATNEYYSEGYYYYDQLLDLGEIYTVRLQSLIQAEGFTLEDLMSNWTTLAALLTMAHAGSSEWDVETHYRTTETLNVMADWTTLSVINPISEGNQDNWTVWKKFTIGDATGRIFQFRLKLISNKVSVTPRVFDGTIKADMPDRIESYVNQSALSGGLAIAYSPAFKGPGTTPAVQITIDGASSGDYWSFDYKTLDGFYIRFFDKNNIPVARQFDAQIKGFGRKATAII